MAGKIVAWALLSGVFYLAALAVQILLFHDGGLYLLPVLLSMAASGLAAWRFS